MSWRDTYQEPRIVLVTGTTFEPVTLQELKLWLKVDEGDVLDDGVISSLNTAARQRIESEIRRSMLHQTFDQVHDETPCDDALDLERAPLVSVVSITKYSDTDLTDSGGVAMSSSEYYVDTASDPGRVVPFNSFPFPASTRRANGFIVRFTAGYSSGSSGVPEQLKTATKALTAYWYERRGDEALDDATTRQRPLPTHVKALLEDFDLPEWG
jgi:uncharacterized phiE125 gp8 family phage protein